MPENWLSQILYACLENADFFSDIALYVSEIRTTTNLNFTSELCNSPLSLCYIVVKKIN